MAVYSVDEALHTCHLALMISVDTQMLVEQFFPLFISTYTSRLSVRQRGRPSLSQHAVSTSVSTSYETKRHCTCVQCRILEYLWFYKH